MNNLKNLSDKELYLICKKWGAAALAARRKFAGLLPEVYAREMAERKKGRSWLKKRDFSCVYEFAAKLAGMSRDQVDLVLRLEKKFEDKPVLRCALVSGDVSANKLARVASIATAENQQDLLGKVESLSNRALEVFVKDFKNHNGLEEPKTGDASLHGQTFEKQNGLRKTKTDGGNLHVQTFESNLNLNLELDEDVKNVQKNQNGRSIQLLNNSALELELDEDVKNELIEMKKKGIDFNQILREFLRERKEKLEREKSEVAEKQIHKRDDRAIIGMPANRYVPVEVRRIMIKEFGNNCSAQGCTKPAEHIHHEKVFAIDQCHDPRFLKPLCRGHHELAHACR